MRRSMDDYDSEIRYSKSLFTGSMLIPTLERVCTKEFQILIAAIYTLVEPDITSKVGKLPLAHTLQDWASARICMGEIYT